MDRYRIKEVIYEGGEWKYFPQKRFLFFWINIVKVPCPTMPSAKEEINKHYKKSLNKKVNKVNYYSYEPMI